MFGSLSILLAVAGLAMLSAGGLAYVLLYGRIQAENKAGLRFEQISSRRPVAIDVSRGRNLDAAKRRKSVQESLKEIEERQKALAKRSKSPPLTLRIEQAGLKWSKRTFWLISLTLGIVIGVGSYFAGAPIWAAPVLALAGIFGLPRWIINFLRKRRMKKFLDEFANAMDVIVRGVKAGLPLHDCVRIIAIQQKAGGNLAEALGNLSRVLRDRKKMFSKIKAMAGEAKASAGIIGALPIIVMVLVYITTPKYIMLLFTDPLGNIILVASAIWMILGVLVMRKMINFDF